MWEKSSNDLSFREGFGLLTEVRRQNAESPSRLHLNDTI